MARNSLKSVMRLIDTAKQSLSPEQDFLNDLKRSIELTEEKQARKPSRTYKPSGMNCVRAMYYQIIGADQDATGASYIFTGICNSGTDIHARIQQAVSEMKNNGMDCEYVNVKDFVKQRKLKHLEVKSQNGWETKLYHKGLNMSFMCDGIIKYKNHYYVLELKTETAHKWYDRGGVDPKHYNQAIAYCLSLELNEAVFVYINRDMLDMKAFLFPVSDDMKQDVVGKIEECDGYVNRKITPPIPKDISKKECEYCSYKTLCRKER